MRKGLPEFDPYQPRDEAGRWTDGGSGNLLEGGKSKFKVTGKSTKAKKAIAQALNKLPAAQQKILIDHKVTFHAEPYLKMSGTPEGGSVLGVTISYPGGETPSYKTTVHVAEVAFTTFKGEEYALPSRDLLWTAFHETGHAIDGIYGFAPSTLLFPEFLKDAEKLSDDEWYRSRDYFLSNPKETWAEMYRAAYDTRKTGAPTFGVVDRERTKQIFGRSLDLVRKFPYNDKSQWKTYGRS